MKTIKPGCVQHDCEKCKAQANELSVAHQEIEILKRIVWSLERKITALRREQQS
jgi:hypothetical protein